MDLTTIPLHLYWLIVYGLAFYAVNELTTKSKVGTIFITCIPVLLIPLLLEMRFNGWFNIFKSFTMLFMLVCLTVIRIRFKQSRAKLFLAFLLYLNIIEALIKDVELGNYFNLLTGFILLIILPMPSNLTLEKRTDSDIVQMTYPMSWAAIIIYTLWHCCFIYSYQSGRGFQGDYFLLNLVLLGIPFLVAYFRGREYWLQTRAYTLAINILLLEATIVTHPDYWPLTPNVYAPTIYWGVSGVVFLLSLSYLIYLVTKSPNQLSNTILGHTAFSPTKSITNF